MNESSIVRENLMTEKGYTPYCGNNIVRFQNAFTNGGCHNPRTEWNGEQFICPSCGWKSEFPEEFISRYKTKWNK